jgi:hypothetical protein
MHQKQAMCSVGWLRRPEDPYFLPSVVGCVNVHTPDRLSCPEQSTIAFWDETERARHKRGGSEIV